MAILILNARTGLAINSQQYEELSKNAVNAIKQVCLGVKGVSPQELTELLQANSTHSALLKKIISVMLSVLTF